MKKYKDKIELLNNGYSTAEFTVVQKLNQGGSGKQAVHCFPVAFFGTCFSTKKSTRSKLELEKIIVLE